ncbi:hypothetical protein ACFQZS_10420 [Mucilaginibacter calamicampi]|uniref:Uncharacterized protein n=1 Tax=Mucilaginibacter calamicampi TaxID=1302352 RepID=A0ABW2YWJ0_9SPHI
MNNREEIEQLAERALHSLDNLQQVDANDFLAAKAWQRMQNRRHGLSPAYNKLLLRLAVVLLMFVGINCVSFYVLNNKSADTASTATGVDAFASAYGLSSSSGNY